MIGPIPADSTEVRLPPGSAVLSPKTRMRIVAPVSADVNTYALRSVAPAMSVQPVASQRSHWKLKRIGALPVHVPCEADKERPTIGAPLTAGSMTLAGASAW